MIYSSEITGFPSLISDRIRTVVNVLGDSFGAAIVEHFSKDELKQSLESPQHMNMVAPYNDSNGNAIKGRENATFVDERM